MPGTLRSAPRLRSRELARAFDALLERADLSHFRARDPVSFAHRYRDPGDQEIAAAIAAALAYGRVELFFPVIGAILDAADRRGGPQAYALTFSPEDALVLAPLYYRWNRGFDFALWVATLGRVVERHGRLGAVFEAAFDARAETIEGALETAITEIEGLAVGEAARLGHPVEDPADLPRSFRTFLPRPSNGSACKRWNMLLRWMIRPADGIDLGLWALPASALVLPLDTHTHRIARYVGLTARNDGSWRTAVEVTRGLRTLDPDDPVRFDFALAHLGISGQCQRRYRAEICEQCALLPVCTFAR